MKSFQLSLTVVVALSLIQFFLVSSYYQGSRNSTKSSLIANVITVDSSGHGDFTTIQGAINSVPSENSWWICIHVNPGFYREKIYIGKEKPFIYLEGSGMETTVIAYNEAIQTRESATVTVMADNFVAKWITFKNDYNHLVAANPSKQAMAANPSKQAVALLAGGDKAYFHMCGFVGFQDTLCDERGRHYFNSCYIEGAIDFIFGYGQSIYENCKIFVNPKNLGGVNIAFPGWITAQGRESSNDPGGFVFKSCIVEGNGPTYLGRAWGNHSRVIFYQTSLPNIVAPEGWDAWNFIGHEEQVMYAEVECNGQGSDTSKRVGWIKKLNASEVSSYTSLSFIDTEGWLKQLP